jgi:hypothetical protein
MSEDASSSGPVAAGSARRGGELERTLGLTQALAIGTGTMVGAGIFVLALVRSGLELHVTHALQESGRDSVVIEGKLKHRYVSG